MNSPAAQKTQLRRELRAARRTIGAPQRSAKARRAARNLVRMLRLRRAHRIAVYLSAGGELDTSALITSLHRLNRSVLVPVVDKGATGLMRMLPLPHRAVLRERRYGIREPLRPLRSSRRESIALVVIPLIGFDKRGVRLGSGSGYYDRWIATQRPRPFLVGYGFAMQEIAMLPAEPWDQRLDAVCTERGLRYFSKRCQ